MSKLLNIGFSNFVVPERVVAILDPESNPIKRIVSSAKESGKVIDATFGRKTRSVIVTDVDHVVLSSLSAETIEERYNEAKEEK